MREIKGEIDGMEKVAVSNVIAAAAERNGAFRLETFHDFSAFIDAMLLPVRTVRDADFPGCCFDSCDYYVEQLADD